MAVSVGSVVRRAENQIDAEVDGEVVLLNVDKGAYFNMNTLGGRIWRMLDAPRSVAELCDALQAEFAVDRATCERDVLAFLEKLVARDLLRVDG